MENVVVRVRADTLANWTAANPIIPDRQLIIVTDTKHFYLGDGVRTFLELGALGIVGPQGPAGADGTNAGGPGFVAHMNGSGQVSMNAVVRYDTVVADDAAAYNVATGIYTVAETGRYLITASLSMMTDNNEVGLSLPVANAASWSDASSTGVTKMINVSAIADLVVGAEVAVVALVSRNAAFYHGGLMGHFGVQRIA